MQIKPLHTLTRQEVRELAQAAVERGEPVNQANPYSAFWEQHDWFEIEYRDHMLELASV